jgi:hypothetical protein
MHSQPGRSYSVQFRRNVTTLCRAPIVFFSLSAFTIFSTHAQPTKDLSPGIAWEVRGHWQVDGQGAPILTGDPIEPGSLLHPGDGTTGDSITLLLPDGQRILYECFKPEDCARGFRVPSLYRTPDPFGVDMLAHIRAAVAGTREKSPMIEPAPPLPRDEVLTVLSSDKKARIDGLIMRLPAGRYSCDLHPLDGRTPKQFHLPFEKTDSPVALALPSAGLYQIIIVDELNSQRIDLVVAAVTPEQAVIGQSFHQAKQLMAEWTDFYYGWPIHDFLRAYLESLMLGAKPGQPAASANVSPPKASIGGQSAKGKIPRARDSRRADFSAHASETTMPIRTTRNPRPPQIQTPVISAGHQDGVRIFFAVFAAGELDDRGKHVEKRNEVENDGRVDEELIGAARGSLIWLPSRMAPESDGLHEDGDVRRLPARMDLAEGAGR